MTDKKNSCAFCGRSPPEIKMSKEHVMRSALGKKFPTDQVGDQILRQKVRLSNGEVDSRMLQIPGKGFHMTVNKVCKQCNEGWLNNKVEIPAEDLLVAAMKGEPISINKISAKKIALWAAKTAAVRALMDRGLRVIPDEHYLHMMVELEPPPGTFVWLAHSSWRAETMTRHARLSTSSCSIHVTTINYGHLCLFIAGISMPNAAEIFLADTIERLDSYDTIRLWPDLRETSWPGHQLTPDVVRKLSSFLAPVDSIFEPGEQASFDGELTAPTIVIIGNMQLPPSSLIAIN